MADFSNLNIKTNGNNEQKQVLLETAQAVQEYCNPDAAKQLNNSVFIFKKLPKEDIANTEREKTHNNEYIINLTDDLVNKSLDYRGKSVCHELEHIDWREKHPAEKTVSKENEVNAYLNGEIFSNNLKNNRLASYGSPFSPEQTRKIKEGIKNLLDKDSYYGCFPEKAPTSIPQTVFAGFKVMGCQVKQSIASFFKPSE